MKGKGLGVIALALGALWIWSRYKSGGAASAGAVAPSGLIEVPGGVSFAEQEAYYQSPSGYQSWVKQAFSGLPLIQGVPGQTLTLGQPGTWAQRLPGMGVLIGLRGVPAKINIPGLGWWGEEQARATLSNQFKTLGLG